MRSLIALAFFLFTCSTSAQSTVEVEVILNEADAGGMLRLALCPSESAFETEKGCTLHTTKATGSLVRLRMPDLVPGTYAVKIFHDLDDDGTMDTNWMGIPTEPYGFSNDAMGTFGPPSFEQARFTVSGKSTTIRIRMKG